MNKKISLALVAILTLGVSGCGFALRGTNDSLQVAPQFQSVQIATDGTSEAITLKQPLIKHLQMRGVAYHQNANSAKTGANVNNPNSIALNNVHFRRYELVGTLTEVRLVLMANVEYRFGDKTYQYPLQVERNYQYNEVSVVAVDGQGNKAKTWLYDNLAERIAEQYRSLAKTTK